MSVQTRRPGRSAARGQALVEFAVVIPLFLVMLVGVFDLGRVVWANNSLANAAREAARFAIVNGGSKTTTCPVGPAAPGSTPPAASASCPYPSPSKQAIVDRALQFAMAGGRDVTVTVCYGANCAGDADTGTNARGTPLTVRVSSTIDLVAPALLGFSTFRVTGRSTMLVNH